MSDFRNKFILVLLALLTVQVLQAQQVTENITADPKNNSPYSRFGLGDPLNQYLAAPGAMGGASAAFTDPDHLNLLNPAALSWLNQTAFEVGVYAKYADLSDETQSADVWSGNLNVLALGFPIFNSINQTLERQQRRFDWGMAFSLQPYTLVGYDLRLRDSISSVGSYSNFLRGSGGTYKLAFNNGWRYENFSFGLGLGYLFGKISNSRRLSVENAAVNAFSTEFLDEYSVSGFTYTLGAQYLYKIDEGREDVGTSTVGARRLIFGAYLNGSTNFNTETDRFYSRDNFSVIPTERDTFLFEGSREQEGTLPLEVAVGVTYQELQRLKLTAEYYAGFWSDYRNEAQPDQLADNYRIAVGAEFIPNAGSYNNYLERIRYRLGGFYGTDARTIGGNQLEKYALTFGFGLPIVRPRQQSAYLNFAFELGRFGLSDAIEETYAQLTLGFTLNDNTWFFKRKFN